MVTVRRQKVRQKKKRAAFQGSSGIDFKKSAKLILTAFFLCVIGVMLVRFKYMLLDSEYFMIENIEVKLYKEGSFIKEFSIKELDGKTVVDSNIFFIDLGVLKEKIEKSHAEFKDVVVRRLLPNRLIVKAELRKAIAQVRSDRYYLIDDEVVILPEVKNFPDPALPVITGIGVNLAKVSSSKLSRFEKERLNNALKLINDVSLNQDLSGYNLKVVDIADPGNISFYFAGLNIEMKIGNSDFSRRLSVLATVLEQLGSDVGNFRYIDLRFDDPIIGPR